MAGRRKDAEGRERDAVAAWFREGEDELPPVESGKRAYLGLEGKLRGREQERRQLIEDQDSCLPGRHGSSWTGGMADKLSSAVLWRSSCIRFTISMAPAAQS